MRSVWKKSSVSLSALLLLVSYLCVHRPVLAESKGGDDFPRNDQLEAGLTFPLRLTLCWYDTYRLLPVSFGTMFNEVSRIFEEVGVETSWELGKTTDRDKNAIHDPLKFYVVLLPTHSSSWGLENDVLGVATHREGMKGSVYMFFPQIMGTLRLDEAESPRAMKLLARAVGRVVAHELVHILAPYYPHTESGLMNARLTRSFLARTGVRLDPVSSVVVRAEIQALGKQAFLASGDFAGWVREVFGRKALERPSFVNEPPR